MQEISNRKYWLMTIYTPYCVGENCNLIATPTGPSVARCSKNFVCTANVWQNLNSRPVNGLASHASCETVYRSFSYSSKLVTVSELPPPHPASLFSRCLYLVLFFCLLV